MNEVNSEEGGKPGKYKKDQCGIQEAGPFRKTGGSWALKIMGEFKFTFLKVLLQNVRSKYRKVETFNHIFDQSCILF